MNREQVEEKIRKSGDRYRTLVENLNEIVYCTDEKGIVTYISPNIESISGYTQSEILHKHFIDFVHPEDVEERMKKLQETMSGESSVAVYRFVTKDKRNIWIRTHASHIIEDGHIVGLQGVLCDITERKQMEEALQKTTERIESVIYPMPVGIIIIDPETHQITDINPKALLMIGAPIEQIIGSRCNKFICPAQDGMCPITDLGQTFDDAERVLLKANGDSIPIHKTVTFIDIDEQEFLLECFIDISAHKSAEQERIKREKLQGVFEMAGAVCHELNQPMQAVLGYSELLMINMEEDDPRYDSLKKVKQQVDRMGKITRKLMGITKYETKEYLHSKIIDIDRASMAM